MTNLRKGLLLVTMEPPADFESEFNDWYDTEHFPQRRALPGFESASRWVCLDGWPRWLALYDLSSPQAVETPAYRAVSGSNSTPWSKRILPRTLGRQRVVAEQVAPGDALTPPVGDVSTLLVARYPAPGIDPAAFAAIAARRTSGLTGLLQLRLFNELGGLWLIAAFARPVSRGTLSDALGEVGDAGARLFNLYAAYVRG
jgi:hypothetical protein